ncbi:hypothetical protein LguiB_012531 [Lonicera macranthoides]
MGKTTASSSSSPILLEEIIFQILKELPVKTLVRFRAVSKLWCSIIDDPFFVDSHRTRSYARNSGIRILCQYKENFSLKIYTTDPQGGSPVPFLTLPDGILDGYHGDYDHYTVTDLQSVNGLVCSKNCIWNPSTRQSIDLPPITIDSNVERCYVLQINLLGFDSVTKQYKVVSMCHTVFGQIIPSEFRILTLGRDLYRRNLDYVPEKLSFRMGFGVCCVDDVLFSSGWVDSNEVIVAFEVGPEKFRVILLPNGADAISMDSHVIQVGGRLGFVKVDYARAAEVDLDELTNVKVVESLHFFDARDVDQATNGDGDGVDDNDNDDNEVEVMNIWILEDYHKQQWKKEIFTFPSQLRDKHYGIKWSIRTKPMGSIRTSEILLCSKGKNQNRVSIYSCSYYDLESKSLRMVPNVTEFPKDYQHPEDYEKHLKFVGFTKHVECLFRLNVT